MQHKIGDTIYVHGSMSISNGSSDTVGGLATIESFNVSKTLPEGHMNSIFVRFKELPGHSYNYLSLLDKQDELKERYNESYAYLDPDIDTPWIESGDIVNGEKYTGPPIW